MFFILMEVIMMSDLGAIGAGGDFTGVSADLPGGGSYGTNVPSQMVSPGYLGSVGGTLIGGSADRSIGTGGIEGTLTENEKKVQTPAATPSPSTKIDEQKEGIKRKVRRRSLLDNEEGSTTGSNIYRRSILGR
jgi:hypothetical protein